MSASLVGSEMCIRDSPQTPRLFWAHSSPWARETPCPWLGMLYRSPRPVSYTHLTLPTICSV
eukprot:735605-Alexandrium_andersonii.AAC.1